MGTQLFDKASDEAAYTLQRRLRLVGYCVPTATLLLKGRVDQACLRPSRLLLPVNARPPPSLLSITRSLWCISWC